MTRRRRRRRRKLHAMHVADMPGDLTCDQIHEHEFAGGLQQITDQLWAESGHDPAGANPPRTHPWILFERVCKRGEEFSIRTEKDQSPIPPTPDR